MGVDPKLVFWTLAVANFAAIVVLASSGIREIRRGNLASHRRRMLSAASLVALFLVSYLIKLAVLGREDRSLWSEMSLVVLYVHELCILVMLLAGGTAGYQAWRFRKNLGSGVTPESFPTKRPERAVHRRAGWTALVAGLLGCVTAVVVLFGMFVRAG